VYVLHALDPLRETEMATSTSCLVIRYKCGTFPVATPPTLEASERLIELASDRPT